MGNFSSNTFDPNKGYTSVRMQQGVPLLDSDWNEMEDIRCNELQLIKFLIGNGIVAWPDSKNDCFAVIPIDSDSLDFKIPAGKAIINGLGLINSNEELTYKKQILFAKPKAELWGVPVLAALTNFTPVSEDMPEREDIVYLDAWEREVDQRDDDNLLHPVLNMTTCVRLKIEWVVRVAENFSLKDEFTPPNRLDNHHYYPIAKLKRGANGIASVSDLRRIILPIPTLENRLSILEKILLLPSFAVSPSQFNPRRGKINSEITLNGKNFNVSVPEVYFGKIRAEIITASITNTSLKVKVPEIPTSEFKDEELKTTITVKTEGGEISSTDTFSIIPPPLLGAQPFNPPQAEVGDLLIISGKNLVFGQSKPKVTIGANSVPILNLESTTKTEIKLRIPSVTPGKINVTVETEGGTAVAEFTVLPTSIP